MLAIIISLIQKDNNGKETMPANNQTKFIFSNLQNLQKNRCLVGSSKLTEEQMPCRVLKAYRRIDALYRVLKAYRRIDAKQGPQKYPTSINSLYVNTLHRLQCRRITRIKRCIKGTISTKLGTKDKVFIANNTNKNTILHRSADVSYCTRNIAKRIN